MFLLCVSVHRGGGQVKVRGPPGQGLGQGLGAPQVKVWGPPGQGPGQGLGPPRSRSGSMSGAPRSRSGGEVPPRYPLNLGVPPWTSRGTPLKLGGASLAVPPELWGLPPGIPPWTWAGAPLGVPIKFGQKCWTKKMDKILGKKWTHILETFGGGGVGSTPLAVTQENCLVLDRFYQPNSGGCGR